MSSSRSDLSFFDRVGDRPRLRLRALRQVRARDLGYRFAAGALTSVVAGVMTVVFGPRAAGIMLGFPAILAASLTLIEEQEDSEEAREDARGAVIGGFAMAVFAAVAAVTLGRLSGALALVLAAVAWFAAAFVGYAVLWFR